MSSPRQLAFDSIAHYEAPATGIVEYQSHGRVLVIGGESALTIATQLESPLQIQVVLTQDSDLANDKSFVTLQNKRDMQLQGYMGSFQLTLTDKTNVRTILSADVVIDLTETPLIQSGILPPAYFAPQAEELAAVINQVHDLVGVFTKPRFFEYDASICAHSRSGLSGCNNCIKACPADAIISIGETIEVKPQLCQGGGACATACPSGAIRYNYPEPAFLVNQIRQLLHHYYEQGGQDACILFFRADYKLTSDLPEHILPIAVEELASVGADLWAAVFSFGAKQVVLLEDGAAPEKSVNTLTQQVSVLQSQLSAMGYDSGALQLIQQLDDIQAQQLPELPKATQSGLNNKRQQWQLALDHLYQHAPEQPQQAALPEDSPFGLIQINQDKCTLCMACATTCPSSAISGGTASPQVRFYPDNCVQCGLCSQGCPENAITLQPTYLFQQEERRQTQVLNEEQPFHCISCNKPFASHTMITNMISKLSGHYMFQSERAQQRLKMCEDCRVVDIVQDPDAMGETDMRPPVRH